MVDLHCHILPGLDDGAATMEESVAMAESAIADGITHVVATPHSSNEYSFDFAHVRQLRDELQTKIGDRLNEGDSVAVVHAHDEVAAAQAIRRIHEAMIVSDDPVEPPLLVYGWHRQEEGDRRA